MTTSSRSRPSDPQRDADGRFTAADIGDHALLDAVELIAREVMRTDGVTADKIGRRRFNKARISLGATGECLTATGLEGHFQNPLGNIIQAALSDRDDAGHYLGMRGKRETYVGRDSDHGVALRACAWQIGTAPTILQYEAWCDADARTRRRRGLIPNVLPDAATIAGRAGSWAKAIAAAGLAPSVRAAKAGPMARKTSDPAEQIISRFVDEMGFLPGKRYFNEWCSRKGISVGRDAKVWGNAVEAARAYRAQRGQETPAEATPWNASPPLPPQVAASENARRGYGGTTSMWDEEKVIAALRDVYGPIVRQAKAKPRAKHYQQVCSGRDDLPSLPTVTKLLGSAQQAFRRAGL